MRKIFTSAMLGVSLVTMCAVASPLHRKPLTLDEVASNMRKASAPESETMWEGLDGLALLRLSDGTFWYYTYTKESEYIEMNEFWTDEIVKSFCFTIYDENLNVVGQIADDVDYKEDEIRLVGLDPVTTLSKKFFNYDDKYELALSFAYNTDVPGINHYYTRVYSVDGATDEKGNSVVVYEMPDKLIGNMTDCSVDSWTENYFVTFVQNVYLDGAPQYEGSATLLETYSKASYMNDGVPQPVYRYTLIDSHLPGDQENTPYMLVWTEKGRAYYLFSQYEKRFFEEPTNWENDDLTQDNSLIAEIFSIGSGETEFTPEKKVKIPVETPDGRFLAVFYSIGNLDNAADVMHEGNDWKFVLTKQYYAVESEDTIDSYYIIDENGDIQNAIFEFANAKLKLSDLKGEPSQYVFANLYNEFTYVFHFVNFPSGEEVFIIPSDFEGYGLQLNLDRIKEGDKVLYAFQTNTPVVDENENVLDNILWIDSEGNFVRADKINVGKDIVLAQPSISSKLLSPYYFNTDSKREYIYNLKRLSESGTQIINELMLVNSDNEVLLHFGPEGDKLFFTAVNVPNRTRNVLQVIYQDEVSDLYSCEFYELPLDKFKAGGKGTEEDPYLISSIGDFNEMRNSPAAYYRLANDIEASGFEYYTADCDFSGVLDGAGHTISNLWIVADEYTSGIFSRLAGGVVKDLNLNNITLEVLDNVSVAGTIAGNSTQGTLSNVHINGLTAFGVPASFGGLIGEAYLNTNISESSVSNADINILGQSVGGIVSDTRTGTVINGVAFHGFLKGSTEVGGIAGSIVTGDEIISNCHVDAVIEADGTVGGIVGSTDRALISNCFVEGEITALGISSSWGDNGPCAGGIAGFMSPNFVEDDGVRISNNIVALSKLEGAEPSMAERWEGQQNTLHYIVGRSRANYQPEIIDYDNEGNPIYGNPEPAETGLARNYHIVMAMTEEIIEGEDKTVDGAPMLSDDLNESNLAALNFIFGDDINAPWIFNEEENLCLFFEGNRESGVEATPVISALRYVGGDILAPGCAIEIYNLSGMKMAEGKDVVKVTNLSSGVYVAVATDASGSRSVVKFKK